MEADARALAAEIVAEMAAPAAAGAASSAGRARLGAAVGGSEPGHAAVAPGVAGVAVAGSGGDAAVADEDGKEEEGKDEEHDHVSAFARFALANGFHMSGTQLRAVKARVKSQLADSTLKTFTLDQRRVERREGVREVLGLPPDAPTADVLKVLNDKEFTKKMNKFLGNARHAARKHLVWSLTTPRIGRSVAILGDVNDSAFKAANKATLLDLMGDVSFYPNDFHKAMWGSLKATTTNCRANIAVTVSPSRFSEICTPWLWSRTMALALASDNHVQSKPYLRNEDIDAYGPEAAPKWQAFRAARHTLDAAWGPLEGAVDDDAASSDDEAAAAGHDWQDVGDDSPAPAAGAGTGAGAA